LIDLGKCAPDATPYSLEKCDGNIDLEVFYPYEEDWKNNEVKNVF
jgi:hypothetical protein